MKLSTSLSLVLLAYLALPSCKDRDLAGGEVTTRDEPTSPTEPGTQTSPDTPPERRWHGDYALKGSELLRLLDAGETETILSHPGASYCEADNRSQTIWLLGDTGLSVYDLESQKLELVVAAAPASIKAFEVRFGLDQGKIGNADGLRDDVALIVVAAKRISIQSEIVCEGAREAACYVDSTTDDPDLWELKPAAAEIKARYDALTLSETPLLKAIAARRLARASDASEKSEDSAAEAADAKKKTPAKSDEIRCGTIEMIAAPATAPSALTQ